MSRFLWGRVGKEVPSLGLFPGVGVDVASGKFHVDEFVDGGAVPMLFQNGSETICIDGTSPLLFLRILTT